MGNGIGAQRLFRFRNSSRISTSSSEIVAGQP
jgi:hypothetical protein